MNLKKNKFKLWLSALGFLVFSHSAVSLETSVQNYRQDNSEVVYERYIDEVNLLKDRLETLTTKFDEIKNCNAAGKIYTNSGCVDPFNPEIDPSVQVQAKSNPSNCPALEQVQVFSKSSNSWECKTIRNVAVSTGNVKTKTWQLSAVESCTSRYSRNCRSSDDTCPGTSNPMGENCTGTKCRYVNTSAPSRFYDFTCY